MLNEHHDLCIFEREKTNDVADYIKLWLDADEYWRNPIPVQGK